MTYHIDTVEMRQTRGRNFQSPRSDLRSRRSARIILLVNSSVLRGKVYRLVTGQRRFAEENAKGLNFNVPFKDFVYQIEKVFQR